MKKIFLFAIICSSIMSCSKDDVSAEKTTATNKVLNFASYEKMDEKIDEISALKAQLESNIAQKYVSQNSSLKIAAQENSIATNLKNYHADRLENISILREKLNFTSIQSIADEINSLKVLNPEKSNKLFLQYEKFLRKNEFNLASTIFENRTGEVINDKGEVIVNEIQVDFSISESPSATGRYIGDELTKQRLAAMTPDGLYRVYFTVGRQKHKDDFGRTFYRCFNEFTSYVFDPVTGVNYYPAVFGPLADSYAIFVQSGDFINPTTPVLFSLRFPFGDGNTIRQVGEQKWTTYVPAGGYLKASFIVGGTISPVYTKKQIITCELNYMADDN